MKQLIALSVLIAASASAQTVPLAPHSDLGGMNFVDARGSRVVPARIVVTIIPTGGQAAAVDVVRNGQAEVYIWRQKAGEKWFCVASVLLVSVTGTQQMFDADVSKFALTDGIAMEYRPWYSWKIDAYAAGAAQPFTSADGRTDSTFGFTAGGFGTNLSEALAGHISGAGFLNCGGIVVVPPRRRPSIPPKGEPDPCKVVP